MGVGDKFDPTKIRPLVGPGSVSIMPSFRGSMQIGRNAELRTQRSFMVARRQVAEPTCQ
jgi:hypothetical protein